MGYTFLTKINSVLERVYTNNVWNKESILIALYTNLSLKF